MTIIVPLYNKEKFLRETLVSLLNVSDLCEVIVVDDGSTDGSSKIYNDSLFADFRVIKTDNRGVSHARNIGIQNASGEFVMFLDADDLISPSLIQELHDLIERSEVNFLCWDYTNDFRNVEKLDNKICSSDIEVLRNFVFRRISIAMGCFIVKRRLLEEHKLYFNESIKYLEDQLFIFSCLEVVGFKSVYVRSCSTYYRLDESSTIHRPVTYERVVGLDAILSKVHELEDEGFLDESDYSGFALCTTVGVLNELAKKGAKPQEQDQLMKSIKDRLRTGNYFRLELLLKLQLKFLIAYFIARISPKAYCCLFSIFSKVLRRNGL